MDDKNGIELPMNGSTSEEAAGGNAEAADDPKAGSVTSQQDSAGDESDGVPEESNQNDEQNEAELLSADDVDAAMRRAVEEELTLNGLDSGQEQPVIKQADFQQLSASAKKQEARNIELLMDVELPVSIELGRTRMNISDILSLGPGSIVELDKLVGEPVDLLVNQKKVARGEVVVVEENFGLRITQLISPEERLKNLQ